MRSLTHFLFICCYFVIPSLSSAQTTVLNPDRNICIDSDSANCVDAPVFRGCAENEAQISVNFSKEFRSHDKALSEVRSVILNAAKRSCAGSPGTDKTLFSTILKSNHAIAPNFRICPMAPCIAKEDGSFNCPPCPVSNYSLSGDALVCCKSRVRFSTK